jgi:hypothetical protein
VKLRRFANPAPKRVGESSERWIVGRSHPVAIASAADGLEHAGCETSTGSFSVFSVLHHIRKAPDDDRLRRHH